jgi:hypothetical protein
MSELSESEERRLAIALGAAPDDETAVEKAKKELESLAYDEFVDWILGRRRFESVSALDRHRILNIFGRVRGQAPTVEVLANELDISESRAVSMLSRMRYGDARTIRALTYKAAAEEVATRWPEAHDEGGLKQVWVTADTGRLVDEANGSIMLDREGQQQGGSYEGAQLARKLEAARGSQQWEATEKMWEMIQSWLAERAEDLDQ